jgi:hypothetical protein
LHFDLVILAIEKSQKRHLKKKKCFANYKACRLPNKKNRREKNKRARSLDRLLVKGEGYMPPKDTKKEERRRRRRRKEKESEVLSMQKSSFVVAGRRRRRTRHEQEMKRKHL